jgi:hypothetical protein
LPATIKRTLAALGGTLVLGAPAAASGTLTCTIADRNLGFEMRGVVGHGSGEPLVSFEGTLALALKGLPAGLRKLTLVRSDVPQFWLKDRELKLRVYAETAKDPHGSVELILETMHKGGGDAPTFEGRYTLHIESMEGAQGGEARVTKAGGRVSCALS